jgi:hypothetical protein
MTDEKRTLTPTEGRKKKFEEILEAVGLGHDPAFYDRRKALAALQALDNERNSRTESEREIISWSMNIISSLSELSHGIVNGRNDEKNILAFRNACDQFEWLKEICSKALYSPQHP